MSRNVGVPGGSCDLVQKEGKRWASAPGEEQVAAKSVCTKLLPSLKKSERHRKMQIFLQRVSVYVDTARVGVDLLTVPW